LSVQPKLKELFFASFHFEKYNPQLTGNTLLCYIDTGILLPTLYSLYLLRRKSNYVLAAYLSIGTLFIAFLLLAILIEGKHYTLIWSYFFAPFSMIILGAKRGLAVSFLFLVLMLLITYIGIGKWMDGYWDYESYVRFTLTDPLTSLYNRRSLKELFPKEFQNAKQEEKHQFSFRIGGDEFAGIITANRKSAIQSLLTKLQEQVQSLEIENKNSPIGTYLTCSIGVHVINGKEYDFYDIYQTADKALYRAKAMGKNCVVFL